MKLEDVFEYNQHFVAMMNIINASRLNPPEHGHKHHIIPKCWFRYNDMTTDDSNKNIVLLTVEDHAKIHKLAYLCAKDIKVKQSMAFAAHMLGQPITNLCNTVSEETKKKMSEAKQGHVVADETRQKISEAKKGHIVTNETRRKMVESHKGKPSYWYGKQRGPISDETKKKMSEAMKGKPGHLKGKHWTVIDGRRTWYD